MNSPAFIRVTGQVFGRLMPETAARFAENLAIRPRPRAFRQRYKHLPAGEPVTFRYGLKALRWGDRGPAIVALHGWEGHPDQFRALAARLAAHGFRVFALTGPGHGPYSGQTAHPGLFVDALFEAAVDLYPLHAVIGHSMGAGAALLALASGLPAAHGVSLAGPAGFEGVLDRIADTIGLSGPARLKFLERMAARAGLPLAATRASNLLPKIRAPLLIVHDKRDSQVPFSDAEALAAHAPNGILLPTDGLGHGRILGASDVLDRIEDFLCLGSTPGSSHSIC